MTDEQRPDVVKVRGLRSSCANCSLVQLCLPVALDGASIERLDEIVERKRPVQRGDHLYRAEDEFQAIYAVRSGALKTYTLTVGGEEQVVGFHLPGELIGLDAINDGRHPCGAVALETTSICEIPFERLEDLAGDIPGLQRQLLRIMSREIFADHEMLHALAKRSAEERLAILLLSLSDRFARRGLSSSRFRLPMSRSDLSNYLGLAPETMSRLFRRFQEKGWASAAGKEVILEDSRALRILAGQRVDEETRYGRA
ncbi:MAG TPA: fumarate/nitrate reduction transcriptional regulator Fnr [Gammaproteobacteria bacterium]|nr:fumarate/nitrate reduction transcriptional regulator Fnr [Gammaproteobacteria bacterium]